MTPMGKISPGDEVSITGCPVKDAFSTARTGPCRMEAVPRGDWPRSVYNRSRVRLSSLTQAKPISRLPWFISVPTALHHMSSKQATTNSLHVFKNPLFD
jgi:hypothetical protein